MGDNWFFTFLDEINGKTRRFLINLGLPVAGYKIEKCGDRYYFGKNFSIDKKNNLYYGDAVVSPRTWKNLAVIENFPRGIRSMLLREFGIRVPRYTAYDDLCVRYGRVTLHGVKYIEIGDWTDPFPGIHYSGREYVFPRGTPGNMHLIIGRDKSIEFLDGDLIYSVTRSRDYKDYVIEFGLKDLLSLYSLLPSFERKISDEFYRILVGIPQKYTYFDLYRFVAGVMRRFLRRESGVVEVGDVVVKYGKMYLIADYKDEFSDEKIDARGWQFVRVFGDVYYRRKIGGVQLLYEPAYEELTVMPVNGNRIRLKVPFEALSVGRFEDIIRSSIFF